MAEVTQTWRFRFEAIPDIAWLLQGNTDWKKLGLRLVGAGFGIGDETMTIVVAAPTSEKLELGMVNLAKRIADQVDTHVIIESLKPEEFFDGERNGVLGIYTWNKDT